jgi:hypothetical protein
MEWNMADGLPPISMDFAADGTPVVMVAEAEARDLAQVLSLAPALGDAKWLRAYVRVANHLAKGDRFDPIMDPVAFESAYRAAYAAEDADEAPVPGNARLHNYGLPDFAQIKPPAMEGDTLVFYARNTFMGIPYKVTMPKAADATYEPVAMSE